MTAAVLRRNDLNQVVIERLRERFGERISTSAAVREQHGKDESYHVPAPPDYDKISQIIDAAIGKNVVAIDWDKVRQVATQANGIPQLIGIQADYTPPANAPGAPQTQPAQQTQPTQQTTLSAPRRSGSESAGAT